LRRHFDRGSGGLHPRTFDGDPLERRGDDARFDGAREIPGPGAFEELGESVAQGA